VPWKTAGIRSGYAYLYDVRSSANVEDYMVDFKVTDFRKVLPDNPNLHLRLRMLNDFKLNDVSLAKGNPPAVGGNIKTLEFLLARRTGKDLDSLFTTVLEPYKDNSYIKSAEKVTMTATETEGKDDVAKAVKVTLNNGRIDYVIYATNNKIKYRVDNSFDFKGCIGVQSIMDGKVVNSYINDGTQLGEVTGQDAATGKVVSFTKELSAENELVVKMDSDIQLEKLNNQFIYIKNTSKLHNGVYPINGARKLADGNIAINVGDTTFIENFKDAKNVNGGYNYNIEEGQTFRIPLATTQNAYPRFKAIDKQIGKVGNPMTFKVASTSADGKALKATAIALPRGANFDAESGKFSWTPGINSFGDNFAAFTVTDGKFSETQHVNIDVKDAALGGDGYRGMFGSAKTDTVEFDVAPNGCTVTTKVGNVVFPKGAIGEGKRGALTMQSAGPQLIVSLKVDGSPYALEAPVKVTSTYAKGSEAKNENCVILRAGDSSLVANARVEGGKLSFYTKMLGTFSPYYYPKSFGDMSNYKWAKPATERLAARGIINGVTENAFAPGANITRADFAVLVVRALGLNAKTGENFADVPSGAYYANEVSIAKSLGIVNGSSGNKFNPTAQISREDMMVMMARALEKTGYSLKANAMAEFTDSAQVSAYAKDAVAKLTKSGLIGGSNGRINPKGKTIRGEVAVLIDRVIFMAR
ncbi:MAG: S-layer homology domain-containing protein, partial [Clostridia bacterium]